MNPRPSIVLVGLTLAATLLTAGCTQPATTAAGKPAETSPGMTTSPSATIPATALATSATPTKPAADPTPEQPAILGGTLKWRDLGITDYAKADERCRTWLGDATSLGATYKLGRSGKFQWKGVGGQVGTLIMMCHLVHVKTGVNAINLQVHTDKPNFCGDFKRHCLEDDVFGLYWQVPLAGPDPALEPFMKAALTRIEP